MINLNGKFWRIIQLHDAKDVLAVYEDDGKPIAFPFPLWAVIEAGFIVDPTSRYGHKRVNPQDADEVESRVVGLEPDEEGVVCVEADSNFLGYCPVGRDFKEEFSEAARLLAALKAKVD